LGDLVILELATMGILYSGRASWLEESGGVFIPLPEKLAVAALFTPEYPVLVAGYSGLGAETPVSWGRILRPPPGAEHLFGQARLSKHSGPGGRKLRPGGGNSGHWGRKLRPPPEAEHIFCTEARNL
jgi:hypothetical protein